MRIRTMLISQVLPAFMIVAMTASTQAQTNSTNGFAIDVQRQTDNSPKSRYRFVPSKKKQVVAPPSPRLERRSKDLDRSSPAHVIQQTSRVAALIPARDFPTSPETLNPTVDASAFHPAGFESPTVVDNFDSRGKTNGDPPVPGHRVYPPNHFQDSVPQPQAQYFQPQQVAQAPAPALYQDAYVPMNRNFFGVNSCECCDEWEGFIACGALKANPGHYGQPFIVGCDPCEPPCGRCSKCLIEKHRAKHPNSCGCNKCGNRSGDCTACGNESANSQTNDADCGCDACATTAKKGGLLGHWRK